MSCSLGRWQRHLFLSTCTRCGASTSVHRRARAHWKSESLAAACTWAFAGFDLGTFAVRSITWSSKERNSNDWSGSADCGGPPCARLFVQGFGTLVLILVVSSILYNSHILRNLDSSQIAQVTHLKEHVCLATPFHLDHFDFVWASLSKQVFCSVNVDLRQSPTHWCLLWAAGFSEISFCAFDAHYTFLNFSQFSRFQSFSCLSEKLVVEAFALGLWQNEKQQLGKEKYFCPKTYRRFHSNIFEHVLIWI